jgi:hypothetical protein
MQSIVTLLSQLSGLPQGLRGANERIGQEVRLQLELENIDTVQPKSPSNPSTDWITLEIHSSVG